jgi:putative nucleotidyltransferase with HDIG domain
MLPKDNASGFDVQQYLLHSLATAGIAKSLAGRVDNADPMDCFIAGLLHDFGKVVFAQFMPAEFGTALRKCQGNEYSLHAALQEIIGVDHAVVGAMLVEKWRFAPHLIETIRHQYVNDLKDTDMIACVFGANQISKKLEYGFSGNSCVSEFPMTVQKRLGGSIDEVIASMGDLDSLFEEAKIFAKI